MRVLVTGGTGYLGRSVVRALASAGHDPVVYSRTACTSGLPGTLIDGDVRDRASLTAAAAGCRGLVHAAALVAVWRRDPGEFDAVNVGGLLNAIAAVEHHRIPRLVYTSSFLARTPEGLRRPPRWNDYQRTKATADAEAQTAVQRGVPIVRLYPGIIYGPGLLTDGNLLGRQIADHLAGRLPGLVGADRIWSFSYVDDVAAAHVAALERGAAGRQYLLGGVNAPQMRAFEIVRDITGRRLPRRLPGWLVALVAAAEETRVSLAGGRAFVTTGTLEILLRDWPLDSGAAEEELGYRITPLEEGIRRIVDELNGSTDEDAGPSQA
ncbi:MAG: NAD-dependent epimerase/dehydratase family protein [Acidobacteriota bacterium]